MSDFLDLNGTPNSNDKAPFHTGVFLAAADQALAAGDKPLALHLYLAAFEQSNVSGEPVNENAIAGLKKAWRLACDARERSLAEHIFSKLEPFLNHGEILACGEQLQGLAMDKLEAIGLSREDLEEMSDMITQGLFGGAGLPGLPANIKIDGVVGPIHITRKTTGGTPDVEIASCACDGQDNCVCAGESAETSLDDDTEQPAADGAELEIPDFIGNLDNPNFHTIHGFATAIKQARAMGVGNGQNPDYLELVETLKQRHGLDRSPAPDTLVFRAPVREDAREFMHAAVGEMGLTGIKMSIDENAQGMMVLCIFADKQSQLKYNPHSAAISGSGVLILEDIDLWDLPPMENDENGQSILMAQLSRGARDALAIIHAAVQNPDIQVVASCSAAGSIEPAFIDMIEPYQVLDIDMPTPGERADIWLDIVHRHPSLRQIDRAALVRYTANMPRCDIYLAAREAVEDAYKAGLAHNAYLPVPASVLFEHIAAYQPLDSAEYRALEDEIVSTFSKDMEEIDGLF